MMSRDFDISRSELVGLIESGDGSEVDLSRLVDQVRSNLDAGLNTTDAAKLEARQQWFGRNYIPPQQAKTVLELMWDAFCDMTLVILTIAGVLSLVLGLTVNEEPKTGWIEGASILGAVAIVLFVTALNDYQKEKQFRELNAVCEDAKIKVIRDGQPQEISKFSLLTGDIVRIEVGDILPADGLVFDEKELKMDESAMTGESNLQVKHRIDKPFLFSGTKVMEGLGKMLVLCVGESSQAGIISSLITNGHDRSDDDSKKKKKRDISDSKDADELQPINVVVDYHTFDNREEETTTVEVVSPLQGKLNKLTVLIGKMGLIVSLLVFVGMVTRFTIEKLVINGENWQDSFISRYLDFFIIGLTVLVVAIPEGLPLAVTISLAYSVKKMLADHNLVRHLDACETMGSATTICSDKTGTLTTNRMTVMRCWIAGRDFLADNGIASMSLGNEVVEDLCRGMCMNSTAEILPPKQNGAQPEHTGNKTECALLQFAQAKAEINYRVEREKNPIAKMLPFSSLQKRMSTVVQLDGKSVFRVYTKGATEVLLNLCHFRLDINGSTIPLVRKDRMKIQEVVINTYAADGYRTLGFAYRDLPETTTLEEIERMSESELLKDLIFVAIAGIEDPVRPEVPDAISQCRQAGIIVRMVTGDNLITAKSIALKCGILTSNANKSELVMEGEEFRKRVLDQQGNLIQSEFDKIWPRLKVLARSSPKDKYTLVSGLISSNLPEYGPQVVAVTGDGTNDAPALKKADVGFAMGICGTAVAKDASDIILMDDNFSSIVSAVKWGRNVYDSIAKFLQFQLTVNIVAISVAIIGAFSLEESPLTAVQLLWVNLIMDTFASLALATESPTAKLLDRQPYPRNKPLISKKMSKHIFGQSIAQLAILVSLIFAGPSMLEIDSGASSSSSRQNVHYTLVFNTFVFLQLFNELNCRKIHDELNILQGAASNPVFVGICILQVLVQVIIIQGGGSVFSTVPLSLNQWLLCVGLGSLSLVLGAVLRFVNFPRWITAFQQRAVDELLVRQPTRGQELWMRGMKRIRAQIQVVNAFKSNIDQ